MSFSKSSLDILSQPLENPFFHNTQNLLYSLILAYSVDSEECK